MVMIVVLVYNGNGSSSNIVVYYVIVICDSQMVCNILVIVYNIGIGSVIVIDIDMCMQQCK